MIIVMVKGYTVKYNDCRKPKQIFKYATDGLCDNVIGESKGKTYMSVVQKVAETKLKGYSCQIVKSRWKIYCGSFSHSKVATIPEVEIRKAVSTSTCSDMINSKKFITRNQQSFELKMNEETIIRVAEKGQISDNNDQVQCKGQPTRINGQIIDNIVVLAQIKIVIMEEDFILNGANLEVVSNHLILDCQPTAGGCRTIEKTFIWGKGDLDDCPLRKVRELQVKEEGEYWIDESRNVVLKKLGPVAAPAGCTNVLLHRTEYEGIFLTEDSTSFLPLGNNMKIANYIEARDDFIMYEVERKIEQLKGRFQENLCSQQFNQNSEGEVVRIETLSNNFALRSGETTYVFECESKEDKIREESQCFEDIPVGEVGFVTPVTRLFTKFSKVVNCNGKFPSTVRSEQSWVELRPSPTPIPAPDKLPVKFHSSHHMDMSYGGIYTEKEINAWEEHIEKQNFHKSVLKKISQGVQRSIVTDKEEGYTLDNLLIPSPLSWVENAKKTVENYTGYLCMAVLMIEFIKGLSILSCLVMSFIREGIVGFLAVLAMLICPAQEALNKMKRRAKREKRNKQPLLEVEEAEVEIPEHKKV